MVYHSIEKNVRVVTILYDIKKKLTPCPRGLLLWGTSCLFRFSNLLHLFKQQQKSTYWQYFYPNLYLKKLLVDKQGTILGHHCVKKPISHGICSFKKLEVIFCNITSNFITLISLFFLSHCKAWFFGFSTFPWNKIISIMLKVLFGVIKSLISAKMVVFSTTGTNSLKNLLLTLCSK